MGSVLNLLLGGAGSIFQWLLGRFAAWGLGFIVPVLTGIGQFIGAFIAAFAEIVIALSKSAEGRVLLAALFAGAGFLYLRFHYIEEGRAYGIAQEQQKVPALVRKARSEVVCKPGSRKQG